MDEILIADVQRTFSDCKKKILMGPITLENLRVMYLGLTNDRTNHSANEIAKGRATGLPGRIKKG